METHQVSKKTDYTARQAIDSGELPIESTNSTYLQHMNDDCLMEIFSVKSLTPMDLCSLAETCTRFQQLTQRVFPKDLRIGLNSNKNYEVDAGRYLRSRNLEKNDIVRILKNFGSFLYDISITGFLAYPLNFGEVEQHEWWEQNNAENYELNPEISEMLTVKLKPIFKQLQRLHLTSVSLMNDKMQFAELDLLTVLSVIDVENYLSILQSVFHKLEKFSYDKENIVMADSTTDPFTQTFTALSTFIARHRILKNIELSIANCDEMFPILILQIIGNNCKELEELRICMKSMAADSLQPLQELKVLKMLKMSHVSFEDFELFSTLTTLSKLSLSNCKIPKDSNQFAFLIQLTKLELWNCHVTLADVVDIIKQLINIEELSVTETVNGTNKLILNKETFSKIVRVVKGRPHILELWCEFNFDLKNCDENQMVRLVYID